MKVIYQGEGTINPTCSKSHITYSFFIDKEYDLLKVAFEYNPKQLKDEELSKDLILNCIDKYGYEKFDNWKSMLPLLNHITLSIDDPDTCRGATHRHFSQIELTLSQTKSSLGMISKKIHEDYGK